MAMLSIPKEFSQESFIIGRLLTGYTDLEFSMADCVSVIGSDIDTTIKVLYRLLGETTRISAADAFGRQKSKALNLETEFCIAIGNIRHCMRIRNNYAHCIWLWEGDSLGFANLEDVANENRHIDHATITARPLNLALLQEQERFFDYTSQWFSWLEHELRYRVDNSKKNSMQKPKQIDQPPLYVQ
ncbi:MAG: hypothetical protein HY255_08920 [Betaproteobacteria bacterium]|nr:hypothetical protein [Betaproteobacteria bacterium]